MFGRTRRTPATTTQPMYTETTTTTRPVKPSLMNRLRAKRTTPRHTARSGNTTTSVQKQPRMGRRNHAHGTTAAPVHHQRRKASIGDKISGAMLKLKGSIEHKPGKKAAGTRRMHGTDGRGARRYY